MAFGDDAALTATVNGPRVDIQVTATGMTLLTVYRRSSTSASVIVRGAKDAEVTSPDFWIGADFEAPPNSPLQYRASISDGTNIFEMSFEPADGVVDHQGDYLTPVGQPNFGKNVTVEAGGLGDLQRDVIRDVVPVLNRQSPVAVSFGRQFFQGDITFLTLEDDERRDFLRMMRFPVLFFAPRPGYGFDETVFFAPGSVTESRTSPLGREPSRRWIVEVTQVDRPPPDYPYTIIGDTWQEILDSGETWNQILFSKLHMYDLAGYGEDAGGGGAQTKSGIASGLSRSSGSASGVKASNIIVATQEGDTGALSGAIS